MAFLLWASSNPYRVASWLSDPSRSMSGNEDYITEVTSYGTIVTHLKSALESDYDASASTVETKDKL